MKFYRPRYMTAAALFGSVAASAQPLMLSDYLKQVHSSNASFQASILTGEAASDKASDADAVFQPTAFATLQTAQDKKELMPTSQRGSQTSHTSIQGGFSKLTEWGTAAKLYYTTSNTQIDGTSAAFVPEPKWYDAGTTFEVSHPLLKNGLGQDLKTSIALQKQQSEISGLTEALKRKVASTEAEAAYWRLVVARESIRTAQDNLDRAKKIVDWSRRRVNSELADNADLLQAEALAELREIELTLALDEERASAHAFNTSRGNPDNTVKEELVRITPELLVNIPVPARGGDREDVQAALTAEKLADLGMTLAGSKYDPSLDVFASATLNGRDAESRTKAMSESLRPEHPTWVVGLKFSAPIGADSQSRMRGGWAKEKQAAALISTRKRYENDREWADLNRKLGESKSRLNLVQKIESTQKKRLNAERNRQSRGQSTMFQVMQSETDFAQSQLNVLRNKAEILGIIARMKTFGGEG